VLLLAGCLIQSALSDPPAEPLIGGFAPHLPVVPSKLAPAEQRSRAAASFIDSLSKNDAMFEVVLGQSRLIVLKEDLVREAPRGKAVQPLIAVGNTEITDFEVLGPRQIRMLGKKIGVTDLVVTDANGNTYSFEVHVVYDLTLLQARIRQLFPDAQVRLAQLGKNLVVEGQARDMHQIRQIIQLVQRGILLEGAQGGASAASQSGASQPAPAPAGMTPGDQGAAGDTAGPEIINLLHVPGPQQVMLKVQFAELDRTAMRQVGIDSLFADGNGNILGTKLNAPTVGGGAIPSFPQLIASGSGLVGTATQATGAATTAFGIFEGAGYQAMLSVLRQNSMVKILAEPNLVTMNGHQATFLAGGEFPVPVPQSGAGGGAATITIQYKRFGVQLAFIPYILDGDTIRLHVDPEVSSIDNSLGIQLSGTSVPGLNTRNAHTVVELKEGQTLAIAGLMQLSINGNTNRIPGLGDLPFIGPFFSNTTSSRVEKELVVLVTPFLVEPMNCDEVPPRPGDEVYEPNDLEFYLLGRLQGRTGHSEFRSTTNSDDPLNLMQRLKLESRTIQGPHGFSD
jgi:pilus assembly protein CpaC